MEDRQDSHQTRASAQPEGITRGKALRVGLILLGKVVGGFLLAAGILMLLSLFLNINISDRERLQFFVFAIYLIVPGFCLWIRAGQAAFGLWRGVCTLAGAFWVTGGVLSFLVLLVYITGEQVPPAGLGVGIFSLVMLGVGIFNLVLGIPILIFGFRPKKGVRSSKRAPKGITDKTN